LVEAVTFRVVLQLAQQLAGEKEAVTPLGSEDAAKVTVPGVPETTLALTVLLTVWPFAAWSAAGDADSVNCAGGGGASVTKLALEETPSRPEESRDAARN
jgi:hypothetical protein